VISRFGAAFRIRREDLLITKALGLAFYERNGFSESGYVARDSSAAYDVLCFGPILDPEEYERLLTRFALHLAPQKVEKKEK
jgi:hypothetical protein